MRNRYTKDRFAYFEKDDGDFRIAFDKNITTRREDVRIEHGSYGMKDESEQKQFIDELISILQWVRCQIQMAETLINMYSLSTGCPGKYTPSGRLFYNFFTIFFMLNTCIIGLFIIL